MGNRSTITGRYISNAAAARHPGTTVVERGSNSSYGTHYRSAKTGQFVTARYASQNPKTTVEEKG